jgi:hypothetical protein
VKKINFAIFTQNSWPKLRKNTHCLLDSVCNFG